MVSWALYIQLERPPLRYPSLDVEQAARLAQENHAAVVDHGGLSMIGVAPSFWGLAGRSCPQLL